MIPPPYSTPQIDEFSKRVAVGTDPSNSTELLPLNHPIRTPDPAEYYRLNVAYSTFLYKYMGKIRRSHGGTRFAVDPWRWMMVFIFFLGATSCNFLWVMLAPSSYAFSEYYGVTPLSIDIVTLEFTFMFAFGSFYVTWLISWMGLRRLYILATLCCCVTCIFRFLSCNTMDKAHTYGYELLVWGSLPAAFSQPVFYCTAVVVSCRWFPVNERDMVTSVFTVFLQLGTAVGQMVSPIVRSYYGAKNLFLFTGAYCLFTFLVTAYFFKDFPPTPVSKSAQILQDDWKRSRNTSLEYLKVSLQRLAGLRGFTRLVIASSILYSIEAILQTTAGQFVWVCGFPSTDSGFFLGCMICTGILSNIIFGWTLSKTQKYREAVLSNTCAVFFALLILIATIDQQSFFAAVAGYTFLGFCLFPYYGIFINSVTEITFPIPAETAIGIIWLLGPLITILCVLCAGPLFAFCGFLTPVHVLLLTLALIAIVAVVKFEGKYARLQRDASIGKALAKSSRPSIPARLANMGIDSLEIETSSEDEIAMTPAETDGLTNATLLQGEAGSATANGSMSSGGAAPGRRKNDRTKSKSSRRNAAPGYGSDNTHYHHHYLHYADGDPPTTTQPQSTHHRSYPNRNANANANANLQPPPTWGTYSSKRGRKSRNRRGKKKMSAFKNFNPAPWEGNPIQEEEGRYTAPAMPQPHPFSIPPTFDPDTAARRAIRGAKPAAIPSLMPVDSGMTSGGIADNDSATDESFTPPPETDPPTLPLSMPGNASDHTRVSFESIGKDTPIIADTAVVSDHSHGNGMDSVPITDIAAAPPSPPSPIIFDDNDADDAHNNDDDDDDNANGINISIETDEKLLSDGEMDRIAEYQHDSPLSDGIDIELDSSIPIGRLASARKSFPKGMSISAMGMVTVRSNPKLKARARREEYKRRRKMKQHLEARGGDYTSSAASTSIAAVGPEWEVHSRDASGSIVSSMLDHRQPSGRRNSRSSRSSRSSHTSAHSTSHEYVLPVTEPPPHNLDLDGDIDIGIDLELELDVDDDDLFPKQHPHEHNSDTDGKETTPPVVDRRRTVPYRPSPTVD